jgi:tetratricopeptide (TPR) repeat protein
VFALAHARMRDALLARLDVAALRDLHRRIAESLEEAVGEAAVYRLAHHFYHAGERTKAIHYGLLGGERARTENAPDAALALYRSAFELMSEDDRRSDRGRGVRRALAWLAIDVGDLALVDEQTTAILDDPDSDRVARGEALLISAMRWFPMYARKAVELCWQALGELDQARVHTKLGVLFIVLGGLWQFFFPRKKKSEVTPHFELVLRIYSQMMESYIQLGSPGLLIAFRACALARRGVEPCAAQAGIMNATALSLVIMGAYKKAVLMGKEALAIADRIDAPFERASAIALFGIVDWLEGNYEKCFEHVETARAIMLKHGFSHRISQVYMPYLSLLWDRGRFRQFTNGMSEVQQIAQRTHSSCLHVWIGGGVMARACRGEYGKAERDRANARILLDSIEPQLVLPYRLSIAYWFGLADLSMGDPAQAVDELREAERAADEVRIPIPLRPNLHYFLGLALMARKRRGVLPKRERRDLARVVAVCRRVAKRGIPFRLQALVLGAAYDAWSGRRERAEQQETELRVLADRCGADSLLATCDFEVGSALLCTGRDVDEGKRRVERASLAFEKMGAHGLAERAREVLAGENGPRSGYARSA